VVIRYFDRDNGSNGEECQQNAVTLDRDGKLWFATLNSLFRLDEELLEPSSIAPPVFITGISLITAGLKEVPLLTADLKGPGLEINHRQNNLRFDFTGLCYRAPERIRYKYQLEGYDKGWSTPTSDRFTTYTNLQPGQYRFRVIACSDTGIWSDREASTVIIIHPAFWQTWWFQLLVILALILISSGISWLVFRQIRLKKQKELEYSKSLAELQFKTLRNQLAPHFIFNSLNAIGSSIFQRDSNATYDLLHKFSRLIRQTLMHADKNSRTLAEELEFVTYYLEIEAVRFENRIRHEIRFSTEISLETMVPRMIIQTFVENAVKHGLMHKEGTGNILIQISQDDKKTTIIVQDDGIGRQAAAQFNGDSTGKGMEIIHEFIRLFNMFNDEKISVEIHDVRNPMGDTAGTRVEISLPLKYAYERSKATGASGDPG
jgi:two-component sensor histidine kinase